MSETVFIDQRVAENLELVSDQWTLLILRDAFLGRTRFSEFQTHTGASRTLLTRRLAMMVDSGLLIKSLLNGSKKRHEYLLTNKAKRLFDAALLAWQWELNWSQTAHSMPSELWHRSCNAPLIPKMICGECDQELLLKDIRLSNASSLLDFQLQTISQYSQRRATMRSVTGADPSLSTISAIIGDRWTMLLLIASFFGVRRYDSFQKKLSIASSILTERLKSLVKAQIFERKVYQDAPPRAEYLLSERGMALFPLVMVLRQWAIDQAYQQDHFNDALVHQPCDAKVKVKVVCEHCQQAISIQSLRIKPSPEIKSINKV